MWFQRERVVTYGRISARSLTDGGRGGTIAVIADMEPSTLDRRRLLRHAWHGVGAGIALALLPGADLTARTRWRTQPVHTRCRLGGSGARRRSAVDPPGAGARRSAALGRRPERVGWRVATDPDMRRVVARGVARADADLAHSVHVEVDGLRAGRDHWFQFDTGGEESPVGHFRTAPASTRRRASSASRSSPARTGRAATTPPTATCSTGPRPRSRAAPRRLHVRVRHRRQQPGHPDAGGIRRRRPSTCAPTACATRCTSSTPTSRRSTPRSRSSSCGTTTRCRTTIPASTPSSATPRPSSSPAGPPPTRRGTSTCRCAAARSAALATSCASTAGCATAASPSSPCSTTASTAPTIRAATASRCAATRRSSTTTRCSARRRSAGRAAASGSTDARWNIVGQQLLLAELEHLPYEDERYWNDAWDGYPRARQRLLEDVVSSGARNPVFLTGDWHSTFVNDLKLDFKDPASPTVATELVTPAITTGGDGTPYGPYYGPMVPLQPAHPLLRGRPPRLLRGDGHRASGWRRSCASSRASRTRRHRLHRAHVHDRGRFARRDHADRTLTTFGRHVRRGPRRAAPRPSGPRHGHVRRAADVCPVRGQRQPAGAPLPLRRPPAWRPRGAVHGEPPALLRDDGGGRAHRDLLHVHQLLPHAGGGRLHRRRLRCPAVHHERCQVRRRRRGGGDDAEGRDVPLRRRRHRDRPVPPVRRGGGGVPGRSTVDDEQLGAAMLYSSGTTGRPKGILRPLPDAHPSEPCR